MTNNEYDAILEVLVEMADKLNDENVNSALEALIEAYLKGKTSDDNCMDAELLSLDKGRNFDGEKGSNVIDINSYRRGI